jgi:hypothetical protein
MPFLVQQPAQAALTHVLLAFHHCLHAYRCDNREDGTSTGAWKQCGISCWRILS